MTLGQRVRSFALLGTVDIVGHQSSHAIARITWDDGTTSWLRNTSDLYTVELV